MTFNISSQKGIDVIPRYTPCEKPVYTLEIKKYLERMEAYNPYRPIGSPRAVCVKLAGQLRYVWRTDVLTKAEYEERTYGDKSKLARVFRSKQEGPVD